MARLLVLLTGLVSGVVLIIWAGFAIVTASRGLDLSDESFYLLSYRWWNVDDRAFSGVQYVYGPVFGLLGHDITALRIFRVATILAANALFGWAFMRWLGAARPRGTMAAAAPIWQLTGILLITSVGGLALSWLPKSPGYNDISTLGALLLGAAVLELARCATCKRMPPFLLGLAAGPVVLAMALSKWASALLILSVIIVLTGIVLLPQGLRAAVRVAAPLLASLALSALLFHLFVARLDRVIDQMVQVTRLFSGGSSSPGVLLPMYLDTTLTTLRNVAELGWPLLLVAVAVAFLRGKIATGVGLLGLVSALLVVARTAWRDRLYVGGTTHLLTYLPLVSTAPVIAAALLAASWVARAVLGRRSEGQLWRTSVSPSLVSRLPDAAVITLLVLLPVVQAAGTGNPVLFLALSCYAPWMALVVWVWSGLSPARDGWACWVSAAALAGLMVATSGAATATGLWSAPYRSAPAAVSTVTAPGIPALASLTFDQQTADDFSLYVHLLRAQTTQSGRYVMAFDELAGLVLMLDGRSVGESWYSASDHERTALGIEAVCRERGSLTTSPPILVFGRPPLPSDHRALKACGLNIEQDYQQLAGVPPRLGVVVLVPKDTP